MFYIFYNYAPFYILTPEKKRPKMAVEKNTNLFLTYRPTLHLCIVDVLC